MITIDAMSCELIAVPSSVGWIAIVGDAQSLKGISFGYESPQAAVAALEGSLPGFEITMVDEARGGGLRNDYLADVAERLQRFVDGHPETFDDVPLDLEHLSPFSLRVVKHCRSIDWGSTLSYLELAVKAGSPRAARAVGNVMRTNRFPLVVPCHRVVAGGGRLGGYSAPQGVALKKRLLEQEALERVKSCQREPLAV